MICSISGWNDQFSARMLRVLCVFQVWRCSCCCQFLRIGLLSFKFMGFLYSNDSQHAVKAILQ